MIKNKAFTIVELIVVITILAILSTIGFISYSGYLIGARDSNRLTQLEGLNKGLNVILTKGRLPIPDTKVDIKSGTNIIAYQGVIGETVLERLGYSNDGIDPKDKKPFLYYITENRKYFQLMGYLEDNNSKIAGVFNNTYAATINYNERYPTVVGSKLGILTTALNEPFAEKRLEAGYTDIDMDDIGSLELKSYLKDNQIVSGSGTTFVNLKNVDKKGGKYYSVVANDYVYTPPVY